MISNTQITVQPEYDIQFWNAMRNKEARQDAESNETLPVSEKYMLTIKEAAAYFNIGIKKLRRIAEDNLGTVAVYCGNRFLIIRPKFEEFILNSSEIQFLLSAESSCYYRA